MRRRDGLQHFFNNTMARLGLHNWNLEFQEKSLEGYCSKKPKIIYIGLPLLNNECKELMLHEIAHINTCRFCNQKHSPTFWKTFEDLMRRFVPKQKIGDSMRFHKTYMTEGIYRKVYQE